MNQPDVVVAPPAATASAASNQMSIISVYVLFSGFLVGPIGFAVGAVLGHVALAQIKRTGEIGRNSALAAIWVGWIMAVVWTVWTAWFLAMVVMAPFVVIEELFGSTGQTA